MVTLLITSLLILGLFAIAVYFWQKPAQKPETAALPPPPVTSLFVEQETAAGRETPPLLLQPAASSAADEREQKKLAAEQFMAHWKESPDRTSTARMLHLAALADDAETYDKAAELAVDAWHTENIPDVSAPELLALLNSEYWLLSSQTRSSGAGFVLKRTLSTAKRKLENASTRT